MTHWTADHIGIEDSQSSSLSLMILSVSHVKLTFGKEHDFPISSSIEPAGNETAFPI